MEKSMAEGKSKKKKASLQSVDEDIFGNGENPFKKKKLLTDDGTPKVIFLLTADVLLEIMKFGPKYLVPWSFMASTEHFALAKRFLAVNDREGLMKYIEHWEQEEIKRLRAQVAELSKPPRDSKTKEIESYFSEETGYKLNHFVTYPDEESVVVQAEDEKTGTVLACKLVRYPMQEIEILKRLQGKNNTIQLLSYKKVELLYPYHYLLVFPWYENTGRNLSTVSTITLKSLWKQLFTALEYCHSLSIIHRDVAPKNVLISGSPLVLADFGLSKIIVNNKLPTDQSGTLEYMAPEVLLEQEYDCSVDIWSAGVTMFTMITGRSMFGMLEEEELTDLFQSASKTEKFVKKALKTVSEDEQKILQWILQPKSSRPTASQILENTYFSSL